MTALDRYGMRPNPVGRNRYTPRDSHDVEANLITPENVRDLAQIHRGDVVGGTLRIPTLEGIMSFETGEMLVHQPSTNKFWAMAVSDFESQYKKLGIR